MKIFADFLSIFLFFGIYFFTHNIFLATKALMIAMGIQVLYSLIRYKKASFIQWVSLGLIVGLGSATLYFRNNHFIMWKPTLLYWAMAFGLLMAMAFKKNGIQYLLGKELKLSQSIWNKLSLAWVIFFILLGTLNLIVAYRFSEAIWINFKVFGCLLLTVIFLVLQGIVLTKIKS